MTSSGVYGTRSSHRWSSQPGRMDALNLNQVWESSERYGIPLLSPCAFVPETLAAWHVPAQRSEAAQKGGALHFFIDDYRFERVWASPGKALDRVHQVGAALTPDFSVWRDMPEAAQIWQTYRARWCGAYWQSHGINVIPTASWGSPRSYDFCFEGLPTDATLAISTVGAVRNPSTRDLFRQGLDALIERKAPKLLLVYGRAPTSLSVETREYPTFWDERRNK